MGFATELIQVSECAQEAFLRSVFGIVVILGNAETYSKHLSPMRPNKFCKIDLLGRRVLVTLGCDSADTLFRKRFALPH